MALQAKRVALWILACLFIAFVAVQFVRPELQNPPVTADLIAPPQVRQILKTSCYNCHSNETKLSWFDRPAPAYWLVAKDVRQARARLNFSQIGALPLAQQQAILYECVNQIRLGAMPLPDYQRLHPESRVTPDQISVIESYLNPPAAAQPSSPAVASAAEFEFDNWIAAAGKTPEVRPAPNGIAFLPDYKNWKAISSTERFDNGTLRQILGNDVAIKAIAENHINPWPDGTAFAKVAWAEALDDKGAAHTGAFIQVEFMIRDSQKYVATKGWGWARWRGTKLEPYGKDADFTTECVGCHTPVRDNDYVFTFPIAGQR